MKQGAVGGDRGSQTASPRCTLWLERDLSAWERSLEGA
jgi:hypothetical protein